jgi:hypothetical protein
MAFIPGQFKGVGDTDLPGAARHPFINKMPLGEYELEVMELRGFAKRDGVVAFAADLKIISGPDGADGLPPAVCFLTDQGDFYYDRDIKALANGLTGGAVAPAEINDAMLEAMCADTQPAAGSRTGATVWAKPKKDGTGDFSVVSFHPLKPKA